MRAVVTKRVLEASVDVREGVQKMLDEFQAGEEALRSWMVSGGS